jgi:protein TonB
MFNNLIESRSHTSEFKRRGSFLLYTLAAYGLLFVAAGVASIYAYDAHLDEQEGEVVTMLSPIDLPGPPKLPDNHPASAPRQTSREQTVDVRPVLIASINHPELPPPPISANPNPVLPVRDDVITRVGREQSNGTGPVGPAGPGSDGPGNVVTPTVVADPGPPPPPLTTPTPKQIVYSKKILNSEALSLPKPTYPSLARQARVFGVVNVQILIDEKGKVVSAHAVSGHPLLSAEAERAAYLARFSPTMIGDTPVKVSGLINYNFVLQ